MSNASSVAAALPGGISEARVEDDASAESGDVVAALATLDKAGYVVWSKRKSPDERVSEEFECILFAMERLESARRAGGQLNYTTHRSCIANIVRRLEAMR